MVESFRFEELDETTRAYLRQARNTRASAMPGVYAPKNDILPALALFVGIALVVLALVLTLPPGPFDDPTNTAMLQMAALLPGVWMILAAFRVWFSTGGAHNIGQFVYADAKRIYDCCGSTVRVIDLADMQSVKGTHNQSDGKYQNTSILVRFPDHKTSLTVHS